MFWIIKRNRSSGIQKSHLNDGEDVNVNTNKMKKWHVFVCVCMYVCVYLLNLEL